MAVPKPTADTSESPRDVPRRLDSKAIYTGSIPVVRLVKEAMRPGLLAPAEYLLSRFAAYLDGIDGCHAKAWVAGVS